MSRFAGRNARLYVAIASGGTAEPITFIKSFSHDRSVDRYDVTAYGDVNKSNVQGLPNAAGNWSGWYDDSTAQLYTAATDGVSRKTYFYPNTSDPTKYFFGLAFFDQSAEFPVDGAVSVSGTWAADGAWTKV